MDLDIRPYCGQKYVAVQTPQSRYIGELAKQQTIPGTACFSAVLSYVLFKETRTCATIDGSTAEKEVVGTRSNVINFNPETPLAIRISDIIQLNMIEPQDMTRMIETDPMNRMIKYLGAFVHFGYSGIPQFGVLMEYDRADAVFSPVTSTRDRATQGLVATELTEESLVVPLQGSGFNIFRKVSFEEVRNYLALEEAQARLRRSSLSQS